MIYCTFSEPGDFDDYGEFTVNEDGSLLLHRAKAVYWEESVRTFDPPLKYESGCLNGQDFGNAGLYGCANESEKAKEVFEALDTNISSE